jgi:hypothetical protein
MRSLVSLKINPLEMVLELINETSATWKEEVICEFFLPMDALAILRIPLCTRRQKDFWAWNCDNKGPFLVRSSYRMMINTKKNRENYYQGNDSSPYYVTEAKGWSTLWKTAVPSKIRVFLWRLAQQSIPYVDVLDRIMSRSSRCSLCGSKDSWKQSLIECNMANNVWALSVEDMVEHMRACGEINAEHWFFFMMETMPREQLTRMCVTLWAICSSRGKAIHKEIFQSPISTNGFIISYIEEMKGLSKPTSTTQAQCPTARPRSKWIPPPAHLAKINMDVAVSKSEDVGGCIGSLS